MLKLKKKKMKVALVKSMKMELMSFYNLLVKNGSSISETYYYPFIYYMNWVSLI